MALIFQFLNLWCGLKLLGRECSIIVLEFYPKSSVKIQISRSLWIDFIEGDLALGLFQREQRNGVDSETHFLVAKFFKRFNDEDVGSIY
ncbi:hypothetical protein RclHR1_07120009 [Rhizophagus clarus]|uniref:Uncharacterized protein n=1 Tax=Rhizophagus clarus TaxID=94130 RepID=A0A2Z6RV23_9GLOM|nr:hypothetical protein RclHR1_07120009 [Rhizophagus clarus]